jgi:hypothetical protein
VTDVASSAALISSPVTDQVPRNSKDVCKIVTKVFLEYVYSTGSPALPEFKSRVLLSSLKFPTYSTKLFMVSYLFLRIIQYTPFISTSHREIKRVPTFKNMLEENSSPASQFPIQYTEILYKIFLLCLISYGRLPIACFINLFIVSVVPLWRTKITNCL